MNQNTKAEKLKRMTTGEAVERILELEDENRVPVSCVECGDRYEERFMKVEGLNYICGSCIQERKKETRVQYLLENTEKPERKSKIKSKAQD